MDGWSLDWVEALSGGLSGPARLRIRGRSMWPTLRPGDEVLVEPAAAEDLVPGDWVVVHDAQGTVLHRYLGRKGRWIVTKGDGHWNLDPLWPPRAVLGRVVEARRGEDRIYRRDGGRVRRERWAAIGHRAVGGTWSWLKRVKALVMGVLLLAFVAAGVYAAVTVSSFEAEALNNSIFLYWVTGSETNNMGFTILRSTSETQGFEVIKKQINSEDDGAGAVYEYEDQDVEPGILYYYELQDMPSDGSSHGSWTASAMLPAEETDEPDDDPTKTPTATLTPSPTATPHPNVSFWADETELQAGECTAVLWVTKDVKAVYLDGRGVVGEGSKTFCPCATETHTLDVTFLNETGEHFTVTLTVSGTCDEDDMTPTPDDVEVGETEEPTATPEKVIEDTNTPVPTPTDSKPVRFPGTGTPVPSQSPTPSSLPESADTGAFGDAGGGGAPERGDEDSTLHSPLETPMIAFSAPSGTRLAVDEDAPKSDHNLTWMIVILIAGLVVGAGLIAAGLWFWRRQ